MRKWLAISMLGLGFAAQATTVTVTLSATIQDVGQNYVDGGGILGRFAAGDVVSFSFDYLADDTVGAGDDNGMKVVVTAVTISTPAYTGSVFNRGALNFRHQPDYDAFAMYSGYDDLTDGYGVPIAGVPLLDGYYLSSFGFNLEASLGGAFTSDSLNQALVAGDFDTFNLHFAFRQPGSTLAAGTMQSWQLNSLSSTANAIPEPDAAALLATGLAAVLARSVVGRRPRVRAA